MHARGAAAPARSRLLATAARRPPSVVWLGATAAAGAARRGQRYHRRPAPPPPRASSSSDSPLYDPADASPPPSGPVAMASLLADLAAAQTADDLQAALLAFLPRHMLEDAEGGGGSAAASAPPPLPPSLPPPPPADAVSALGAASLPRALELMLRRPPDEQPLDSFALRHLVLTRPRALEPLSAFAASPSRFVQRVGVLGATGERAVLTFTLARRGAGRGARRHAATSPRSAGAAAHWFLVRVEGEQGSGGGEGGGKRRPAEEKEDEDKEKREDENDEKQPEEEPTGEELAPETVVARQLAALGRGDLDEAYALTSPVGRAVAGDRARFAHLLTADARFAPLMRHGGWHTLRRTQSIARSFVEVVSVRSGGGGGGGGGGRGGAAPLPQEAVFAVIASLHPCAAGVGEQEGKGLGAAASGGGSSEMWLLDYITPIRDKALLATLLQRGGAGGDD